MTKQQFTSPPPWHSLRNGWLHILASGLPILPLRSILRAVDSFKEGLHQDSGDVILKARLEAPAEAMQVLMRPLVPGGGGGGGGGGEEKRKTTVEVLQLAPCLMNYQAEYVERRRRFLFSTLDLDPQKEGGYCFSWNKGMKMIRRLSTERFCVFRFVQDFTRVKEIQMVAKMSDGLIYFYPVGQWNKLEWVFPGVYQCWTAGENTFSFELVSGESLEEEQDEAQPSTSELEAEAQFSTSQESPVLYDLFPRSSSEVLQRELVSGESLEEEQDEAQPSTSELEAEAQFSTSQEAPVLYDLFPRSSSEVLQRGQTSESELPNLPELQLRLAPPDRSNS